MLRGQIKTYHCVNNVIENLIIICIQGGSDHIIERKVEAIDDLSSCVQLFDNRGKDEEFILTRKRGTVSPLGIIKLS